jgi:hypothetical protein
LFIPDVTISNRSYDRTVNIGVALWVRRAGGSLVHCGPETKPIEQWEKSRQTYRNSIIVFPLHLEPLRTVHGYVAFCADLLRSVAPEPGVKPPGLCKIEFIDYLSDEVLHEQDITFYA